MAKAWHGSMLSGLSQKLNLTFAGVQVIPVIIFQDQKMRKPSYPRSSETLCPVCPCIFSKTDKKKFDITFSMSSPQPHFAE